jgi:hypothetical protein
MNDNLETSTAGLDAVPVHPSGMIVPLQKKVMLVLPWQKHTSPMAAFSVFQLADRRRVSTMLNFGDAFIAHARNHCADVFLQSKLDWMLTVDDDMIVPCGDARWFNAHTGFNFPEKFAGLNAIDRLMSHGKTLVGAAYWGRHVHGNGTWNESTHPKEAEFARSGPHDIIKPTKWVGTGCMLIHRSVFLDIEKKFPRLGRGPDGKGGNWFSSSEHTAMDWIARTQEMLSNGPMDGIKAARAHEMLGQAAAEAKSNSCLGMGEDVQFCVRAREAGHQPYVDLGLCCGHIGHRVYGPGNTSPAPLKTLK